MTAGHAWSEDAPRGEDADDETAMNRAPGSLRHALDRPVAHPPGETGGGADGPDAVLAAAVAFGAPLSHVERRLSAA